MTGKINKEWLIDQLDLVFRYAERLADVAKEEDRVEYNSKTVLKLAKFAAAIEIYTSIMNSQNNIEYYYVDALAGSGLTYLKQPKKYAISSPIIAPAVAHEPFKKYYYVERDPNRARVLEQRLEYVSEETRIDLSYDDWVVIPEDANKALPKIMDELDERRQDRSKPGVNVFRFVDNHGRNVNWNSIETMSRIWGDFLITFPTKHMPRDVGTVESEPSETREIGLNEFFGCENWKMCQKPDDYAALYENNLTNVGYEKKTKRTRVRGSPESRGSYYDVIYATRKTPSGSPYTEGIDYVNRRIENNDERIVNDFIEKFVYGNQTSFDLFDEDTGQFGLDHFN